MSRWTDAADTAVLLIVLDWREGPRGVHASFSDALVRLANVLQAAKHAWSTKVAALVVAEGLRERDISRASSLLLARPFRVERTEFSFWSDFAIGNQFFDKISIGTQYNLVSISTCTSSS